MGYKAQTEVTALDYDFNPFIDSKGVTPEPDTDQLREYWGGYSRLMRGNQRHLREWEQRYADLEKLPAGAEIEERRRELDEEYEASQDVTAKETLDRRRELMAAVCSNQPSLEDLRKLQPRVFDDFETYMQEELSPLGRKKDSS